MAISRNLYRLLVLLGVALAIASILFLIANLKNVEVGGEGSDWHDLFQNISKFLMPLALTLGTLILLFMIYYMIKNTSKKRAQASAEPSKINYLAIFVFLSILVAIMLVSANLDRELDEEQEGVIEEPTDDGSEENGLEGQGGGSALFMMLVMGAIMVVPILLYLYGRNIFIRPETAGLRSETDEVVEDAIARIRRSTGDDLRDAVIQSYAEMVELVNGRIEGEEVLTPKEFARAAVQGLGWPSGPVEELTQVFEEARYSKHELTLAHKDQALSSLERIRADIELGGGRIGGTIPATP